MPNVFEIEEYQPFCNLIICGDAQTGVARLAYSQESLPAFQALTPEAEPSAGLPYFRLTLPADMATGFPGSTPEPVAPPIGDTNLQTLAEILSGIEWVTLVIGASPESLSIALVIARYARGRGNLVTVLQSVPRPVPYALRQALLEQVDLLCPTPAGLNVLDAAQALWSCVNTPSIIGVDFGDFSSVRGMGAGQLLWMPLANTGESRMRDMMTRLPPFYAEKWLWVALVMPESVGLDEFTTVGEHLHASCGDETSVIISCPTARGIPYGIYVFLA